MPKPVRAAIVNPPERIDIDYYSSVNVVNVVANVYVLLQSIRYNSVLHRWNCPSHGRMLLQLVIDHALWHVHDGNGNSNTSRNSVHEHEHSDRRLEEQRKN